MPRKTAVSEPPAAPCGPCFNEAAARCRGKPRGLYADADDGTGRFNEAAARCRGKPGSFISPRRFSLALQ